MQVSRVVPEESVHEGRGERKSKGRVRKYLPAVHHLFVHFLILINLKRSFEMCCFGCFGVI